MGSEVAVQLGMFGVGNRIAGAHVVQAHTRVLTSGDEVFVGEHLRWNRGRRDAPAGRKAAANAPDDDGQQDLFGG
jgi:hypothetical protein